MGRSPCCDKNTLKKGPWTTEEDTKLINYIQLHGPGNWRTLPNNAGLQRCGKSCRLRWANYLRPDIKRGRFSFEEEETIIQLHSVLGNKWSAIAARLPGRTDNEIKNYWNTHIRKRLLRSGIDPVTHERRLDNLDLSLLMNSSQLNLSNLVHLNQQPLINPEVLRLALSLGSLIKNQNSEILMQNFQENRLVNPHAQIQNQVPAVFQLPNQFENNIINQQIPPMHDHNLVPTEGYMGHHNTNSSNDHISQEYYVPVTTTTATTSECHPKNIVPIVGYGTTSDQITQGLSENSSLISSRSSCSNSNNNNNYKNVSQDSIISTPLSSPPRMNGSAENEMKSFCNAQLYRFESLNFDDFM